MFELFNKNHRYVRSRHNIPYKQEAEKGKIAISSVVIPCTGSDYIEEAVLSAEFASRFAKNLEEIVIVSDQPASLFPALPQKVRVATLDVPLREESYRYKQIYRSRLIKIQAPLQAKGDGILMIDSDLNLLQDPEAKIQEHSLYSSFRQGKMIAKMAEIPKELIPAYYKNAVRPVFEDHVNSAYLIATRSTWKRLCPLWSALFQDTWELMSDNQPPTDQLPLAALLDLLDIKTINLGDWVNWPVSKRIGGQPAVIPSQVIGAHGGFPLSEWQKYLHDPTQPLTFRGQDYTRKVRYLTDAEKQQS